MTDCPWPKNAPTVSRLYPSRGYAALSRIAERFSANDGIRRRWHAVGRLDCVWLWHRHYTDSYCGVRICLSFNNKAGLVFTRP